MVVQSRILVLFVVIGMAACSGDDTGIEVILEPEVEVTPEPKPVEEVIPEPVVETVDVPTLESWGVEDGSLEIVNGNCNLPIFKKAPFPRAPAMKKILEEAGAVQGGGPECLDDDEGSFEYDHCPEVVSLSETVLHCTEEWQDYCIRTAEEDDSIDRCGPVLENPVPPIQL